MNGRDHTANYSGTPLLYTGRALSGKEEHISRQKSQLLSVV